MYKRIINVLLVTCFALPSWAGEVHGYISDIKFTKWFEVETWLIAESYENDTIWTIQLRGRDINDKTLLLIKTIDDKNLELKSFNCETRYETDSLTTSPLTGKLIDHQHVEYLVSYSITSVALHYFIDHGISKIRVGTETRWEEKIWQRNEWGKNLTETYKKIIKKMSPDYVPPKKPSIRDGF